MITVTPGIQCFIVTFNPCSEIDVAGYVTHASDTSGFTPSSSNLVSNGPDTKVTVPSTAVGMLYIRVAAYDSFEDPNNINFVGLNYSTEYSVDMSGNNPLDTVAPAVPTGITLTSTVDTSGQADVSTLVISWTATPDTAHDLDGYGIQVQRGTDTSYTSYVVDSNTTSLTLTGLVPNLQYSACVNSFDRWGNYSAYSPWSSTTTAKSYSVPPDVVLVSVASAFKNLFVSWGATSGAYNYSVDVAQNSGFTSNLNSYTVFSNNFSCAATTGTTYYVRVRAITRSGVYSANYSNVLSTTAGTIQATDINNFAITASKLYLNIPVVSGDVWTDNYPSSGYVTWNAHTLYYGGASYSISPGNTSSKYIYWTGGTTYSTAATSPALSDGQFIIATNVSGYHDVAWNSIANQVIGTAYIADAAISNAKIANLAVDYTKIADATITAAQIADATITSAKISALTADKIATGALSATTTITSGTAFGNGKSPLTVDGVNSNIRVNDGTYDRVTIGKLGNGSYGISILNGAGNSIFYSDGNIDGTKVSNLIANQIISGTITAYQTITVGGISIASGSSTNNGSISLGQTGYNTGTGFWLGNMAGSPKFSIGDSSNYLKYDTTNGLVVNGTINATAGNFSGNITSAATITGGTFQTSSSGQRFVVGTDNTARFYNGNNTQCAFMGDYSFLPAGYSTTLYANTSNGATYAAVFDGYTLVNSNLVVQGVSNNVTLSLGSGANCPNIFFDMLNNTSLASVPTTLKVPGSFIALSDGNLYYYSTIGGTTKWWKVSLS